MADVVFGTFGSLGEAGFAMNKLLQTQVSPSDLNLVAHTKDVPFSKDLRRVLVAESIEPSVVGSTKDSARREVHLRGVKIPGIGMVVAMGKLASASVGSKDHLGGLLSGLRKLGVPEKDMEGYVEAIRHGGAVLGLACSARQSADVSRIIKKVGQQEAAAGIALHAGKNRPENAVFVSPESDLSFPTHKNFEIAFVLPGLPIFPKEPKPNEPPPPPPAQPPAPGTERPPGVQVHPTVAGIKDHS